MWPALPPAGRIMDIVASRKIRSRVPVHAATGSLDVMMLDGFVNFPSRGACDIRSLRSLAGFFVALGNERGKKTAGFMNAHRGS